MLKASSLLIIVYYVPGGTMRVLARRATMLAGDRSRDGSEARSVLRKKKVLQLFAALVITLEISRLVPAILILSILCSSNGFQQTHAQFKYTRLCQQGANAVRRKRRRLCSALWLQAHAQFNFYIAFLCSAIHNIALLLTVAKKRVYAPEAHKIHFSILYFLFYAISGFKRRLQSLN